MDEDAAKAERKRLKKAAKRAAKAAKAEGAAPTEAPEELPETQDGAVKKKKRKETEREGAAVGIAVDAGKKAKLQAAGGARASGLVLANVGDKEGAAAGPLIRKAFYTECAELAALSETARALPLPSGCPARRH
jgi:hypothetical protein